MPFHLGYNVSITCNRRDVEHHNIQREGANVVKCYVESEAGKEFAIEYSDSHRTGTTMGMDCYIDGNRVATKTAHPGMRMDIWGLRTGESTRSPFVFSPITLLGNSAPPPQYADSDDTPILLDDDEADGATGGPCMGLIEVKLYRVRIESRRHVRARVYTPRPLPLNTAPISEKSKKGGWHQISLGSSLPVTPWRPCFTHTVRLDPANHFIAIFRFYYRPREILLAEGIIPRAMGSQMDEDDHDAPPEGSRRRVSPPPDPRDAKRRRISAALQPSTFGTENEVIEIESDDEPPRHVKHERGSPIRLGSARGEVIDLTMLD